MKKTILLMATFLFLNPVYGYPSDNDAEFLSKLISIIQKGNSQEKICALQSLWLLRYEKYRKDPNVYDPIFEALNNKDAAVREAAAAFFCYLGASSPGCCKETNIVPALIKALADENPGVRAEAAAALAYYKDKRTLEPLMKCLNDKNFLVRINSAFALGELRSPDAASALLAAVDENSDWRNTIFQQECLIALRKINKSDASTVKVLMNRFDDKYLKPEIIKTLGHFQAQESRELLVKATEEPDEKIRTLALTALEKLVRTETKHVAIKQPPPVPVKTDANGKKSYRAGGFAEFGSGSQREKTETKVIDYEGRFDVLLKAINDPSPDVRATAAVGLGQIKNKESFNALIGALKDSSPNVKIKAIESLGQIKDDSALQPLLQTAQDSDKNVQEKSIQILKNFNYEEVIDGLLPLAGVYRARETIMEKAKNTAQAHVYVYWDNGKRITSNTSPRSIQYVHIVVHPLIVGKILNGLSNGTASSKAGMLYLLREFKDERSEAAILTQLDDPDEHVREAACKALEVVGTNNATDKLMGAMKDQQPKVRTAAARAAGLIGDARAFNQLIALLDDSSTEVKASALSALGKYNDPKCLPITIQYLTHPESAVRTSALLNLIEKPDAKAVEYLLPLLNENRSASLAAEALGKTKDSRAAEALINILVGGDKNNGDRANMELREKLAGLLGDMGDKKAIQPMLAILLNDQEDIRLRRGCALSLGKIGDESAVQPLEEALAKKLSPDIESYVKDALKPIQKRVMNAKLLATHDDPELAPVVIEIIQDPEKKVENTAIGDLAKLKDKRAIKALTVLLTYNKCSPSQRYHALELLAAYDEPEVIPVLVENIEDPYFYSSHSAIEKKFKGSQYKSIWESFVAMLKTGTGNSTVRSNAVRFLAASDDPDYIPLLIELINDPDNLVAVTAIKKFSDIKDERAIEHLIAVVKKDQNISPVRRDAARALVKTYSDPAVVPVLIAGIDDSDRDISERFMDKLADLKDETAIPYLLKIIGRGEGKEDEFCKKYAPHCIYRANHAKMALMKYNKDEVADIIKGYLNDSDPQVRTGAQIVDKFLDTKGNIRFLIFSIAFGLLPVILLILYRKRIKRSA